MKYLRLLMVGALLSLVAGVPAQAQTQYPSGYYGGQPQSWHAVLSPEDQQQFDHYYTKWVDASRKNDRDDIASNARHMQDIMARYNIPANVSFDQVASNAGATPYPNGTSAGAYQGYGQARLSPEDQRNFDKYYSKWMDAQRKNDRDDIDSNARKMQEIMARYNIPANVSFAAIASNGGYAAAPNGYAYGYAQPAQRLSAKDQADFDKYYRGWVKAKHKKDVDDIDKNARKMQEIMARYNIPANVSFQQIASGDVPF